MLTDSVPQPLPDVDSKGFWDHTAKGKLTLQHCSACDVYQFPSLEKCRSCAGGLNWKEISGHGTVYSFLIEHHTIAPGFENEMPYVVALVSPDEAPYIRFPGRMVDVDPHSVKIGDTVIAEIIDLPGGDYRVPVFKPAP